MNLMPSVVGVQLFRGGHGRDRQGSCPVVQSTAVYVQSTAVYTPSYLYRHYGENGKNNFIIINDCCC
jgi:hypothetical protein